MDGERKRGKRGIKFEVENSSGGRKKKEGPNLVVKNVIGKSLSVTGNPERKEIPLRGTENGQHYQTTGKY